MTTVTALDGFWLRQKQRERERKQAEERRRKQAVTRAKAEPEAERMPDAPKRTVEQAWSLHESILRKERQRSYARSL